ncbi:hypothetical protein Rumeso_04145 [Rubellimicrobium mesophilum DSM 19309]|uniref:Uncharacterized protein n=1 Tax=Rubellimicrobium mesophilum DSM 19309 TaxID=442562 RepID=A0A017HIU1_9RHOB|nr:hypothetical protein [Rubellimicrobium mesophilum]EYD74281.1 hypothetical protein Rumeso_04145 [Rubellimicrobium mesophilum DSM 19309]
MAEAGVGEARRGGARRSDDGARFLIGAVPACLAGAALGLATARLRRRGRPLIPVLSTGNWANVLTSATIGDRSACSAACLGSIPELIPGG